ncbi:Hsp20/alpha crystallin family protein [Alteribacillus sp. JSM 102045]|uniref:Hsp20/alpha crystallin family protein n=1 Tax=Alteribacillus sp. JSM 102045 TaxID=1562101 RepID=UPI0035C00762
MTKRPIRHQSDIFNEVFDTFHDLFSSFPGLRDNEKTAIREEGSYYVVEASLPGFESDRIFIEYEDEYVTIKAVHDETDKVESDQFFRQTSRFEEFYKKIHLGPIKGEEIKVSYVEDLLVLHIPKRENPLSRERFIGIDEKERK